MQGLSEPHRAFVPAAASGAREAEVLTKAVLKAAQNLGITARALGRIIGLSEATVSRLKNGERQLEPAHKSFELAALFVRFYRALDAIVGGDDAVASAWLSNRNTALDGAPLDLIQTAAGLMHVIQYLDTRRAVI